MVKVRHFLKTNSFLNYNPLKMLFHSCLEMTNNDSHFENDNNDSQFENDNNDSQFACTNSNNHVTGKHTGKAKKKKNLGSIIQLLSSPVKHTFKRNLANSVVTGNS